MKQIIVVINRTWLIPKSQILNDVPIRTDKKISGFDINKDDGSRTTLEFQKETVLTAITIHKRFISRLQKKWQKL